jgi:hypothetical protein
MLLRQKCVGTESAEETVTSPRSGILQTFSIETV